MVSSAWAVAVLLPALAAAQKPQYPPAFPLKPILPSAVAAAPSVVPNVQDPTAPDAQKKCSGYKASNVKETSSGVTADLSLAGTPCNVYGNDVADLTLQVQYQSKGRLNVRIQPRYLDATNQSIYLLSPDLIPQPAVDAGASANASDLAFQWSNNPSFQFKVSRRSSGEVIFDTTGSVLVFEDQFLEVRTAMVADYNVYGLADSLHSFRLGTNYTQTHWSTYYLNNDQQLDVNLHDSHPMYLETRYHNGSSSSHGVYSRNAHGQDWLMRESSITYRTIGGSFDLYFVSGPSAKDVISQYHGIIGHPAMPAYWHLGFHQNRWGYLNWTNLQDVIDSYAHAGIQLEGIMNDLDYLHLNRPFTHNEGHYDVAEGKAFLARLHAAGQYWLPILNAQIYVPNATESYPVYERGNELDVYIRDGTKQRYIGDHWSGLAVFVDFLAPNAQQFWTEQFVNYYKDLEFDGWWLDVSDPVSWNTGSFPPNMTQENPIHVPFALPGDPDTAFAVDFRYPEQFAATNASEAASASSAAASQSSAYPMVTPPLPVVPRVTPVPGRRNLTYPPYNINNAAVEGHTLGKEVISPDATHNDPHNLTEYEVHNLYGYLSAKASYNALLATKPGVRPFILSRSTFAGSGNFSGHWGGDTNSNFANMYQNIAQALRYSIAGIPYFGVETVGFNGNADMELATRWQQLSAWFGLYRNHNNRNTIAQEAYRWATTAEATRRIMNIRYSLLPYTYTLFQRAHVAGETVLRALAWEFPDDESLRAVETQFMSGPALLITPVLVPLATTVKGVFPGVANGTIWYDWYTLEKVSAQPGENKTLDAPLVHQPIHVRGGYIIPIQRAGNTTKTSKQTPWSLLVALDKNNQAQGSIYIDDGISLQQKATKDVELSYANNTLHAHVTGNYNDGVPLANVTIAGFSGQPQSVSISVGGTTSTNSTAQYHVNGTTLYITGLNTATHSGAWAADIQVKLNGVHGGNGTTGGNNNGGHPEPYTQSHQGSWQTQSGHDSWETKSW